MALPSGAWLFDQVILDYERIESGRKEDADRVLNRVDHRFSHDVEARVQDQWNSGQIFKFVD